MDRTIANMDALGITVNVGADSAEVGYFSDVNVKAFEQHWSMEDAYVATGRIHAR